MCVIVVKPADVSLTKREIKKCWKDNPHGGGFMYTAHGKLQVVKGFFTFRTFYSAFRCAERSFPMSTFVLHMRIATSGKLDEPNCHPFYVNRNIAVAHNGIFSDWTDHTSEFSDTFWFTHNILAKLPEDFFYNQAMIDLLEDYCGFSSKLVLLNSDGDVQIVNETLGVWHKGRWFSNDVLDTKVPTTHMGFHNYAKYYV